MWFQNFPAIGQTRDKHRHLHRRYLKIALPDGKVVGIANPPDRVVLLGLGFPFRRGNKPRFLAAKIDSGYLAEAEFLKPVLNLSDAESGNIAKASADGEKINVGGNSDGMPHIHPAVRFPIVKDTRLVGLKGIRKSQTAGR